MAFSNKVPKPKSSETYNDLPRPTNTPSGFDVSMFDESMFDEVGQAWIPVPKGVSGGGGFDVSMFDENNFDQDSPLPWRPIPRE